MRFFIRHVACHLLLILAAATTAIGQGAISADSPELPLLPPPPIPKDTPSRPRPVAPVRVTFFPPTAPPFGAPIRDGIISRVTFNGRQVETPSGLGDFVSENFYPALSTRLVEGPLPRSLAAHLESYRASRTALVNELYDQLRLTEFADPDAREHDLREFAVAQEPQISALEKDAEQLRDELVRGTLLQSTADWNELRQWKLGALPTTPPARVANAEFQVIRAAPYFSRGFTPVQRDLLRELAMEQQESLASFRVFAGLRSSSDPSTMFFSPETSRLHLPKKLPAKLSAKIGVYNHDKTELKNELREAVVAEDQHWASTRTRSFAALAERQRARLDALAVLAEEIRRGLAELPKPPRPALPPDLPAELVDALKAYRLDKLALDSIHRQSLSESIHAPPPADPAKPMRDRIREMTAARIAAMNRAEEQFQIEHADRIAELLERGNALRRQVDIVASIYVDPVTGRPMDASALVRAWDNFDQQFAQIGREEVIYKDYNIAMLMPGLSPGQRRLLFGAALVGLAQPLPGPERLPPSSP